MNIRMTESDLRFRLEPEDVEQLLLHRALETRIQWARYLQSFQVVLSQGPEEMSLVQMREGIILNVNENVFDRFVQTLPNKYGLGKLITTKGVDFHVSLEVNSKIKKRMRDQAA